MDAPAGRRRTRCLRRACQAPALWRAITGAIGAAAAAVRGPAALTNPLPVRAWWRSKVPLLATLALLGALGYFVDSRLKVANHGADGGPVPGPPTQNAAAFNPPPHSIAVLPFVNLSGDKDQEYFTDGLLASDVSTAPALENLCCPKLVEYLTGVWR